MNPADAAPKAPAPPDLEGLTAVTRTQLARAAVRLRESSVTLAAWRLELAAAQGLGALVLIELPGGVSLHRGEGVCLGFAQPRLKALWAALSAPPPGGEPELEMPQLG